MISSWLFAALSSIQTNVGSRLIDEEFAGDKLPVVADGETGGKPLFVREIGDRVLTVIAFIVA